MKISVIAFIGLMANVVGAIELTEDNYAAETDGKTAFIKFFAPWCGHCKKMKPNWDKLMDEFKDSSDAIIADVDCTTDGGKPLCEANGVRGYPTLKWGDPAALEDYSGARDLDALKKFAEENLKPMCSPTNIELCDEEQTAEIKKYLDLGEDTLKEKIAEKEAELAQIEVDFKTAVEGLQEQYKKLTEEKEEKYDAVTKEGGLSTMQKCLLSLKKKGHEEL